MGVIVVEESGVCRFAGLQYFRDMQDYAKMESGTERERKGTEGEGRKKAVSTQLLCSVGRVVGAILRRVKQLAVLLASL